MRFINNQTDDLFHWAETLCQVILQGLKNASGKRKAK